ncbi:uncharacterized protein BJ171DRAFT_494212 [Polychytrium aggregatum]|uniref:uncharacterized protein n=1 Tax=Polychytrium aggregatum TaxID=110093 RepID=UPI0022FDBDB8|nr:uncharacterized protein BJ171DRAFT_494212 [Polychytrium aggregatum]KAI9207307.1 hypothetical protein BJ171DRAFT_494212 [Polychytrium aggregatum]
MKHLLALLLAVLLLAASSVNARQETLAARTLRGRIVTNDVVKDLDDLGPNTRVYLNGGEQVSLIDKDGYFQLNNLPEGSHLVEIVNSRFFFEKIRIDVSKSSIQPSITYPGTNWEKHGPLLTLPLEVSAHSKLNYFMAREGFSIWSLFQNPMMLMAIFGLVMVIGMPKLMNSLDQETLQEVRQQRQQNTPQMEMPDISQNLANMFAPKKN